MHDMDPSASELRSAEAEVEATIFYLTAFGWVDGEFEPREKAWVRDYAQRLAVERLGGVLAGQAEALGDAPGRADEARVDAVLVRVDQEIAQMWDEPVAPGEGSTDFVRSRLKLRCFELFRCFDEGVQRQLMDAVDQLMMADGVAHAEELKFRGELAAILRVDGKLRDRPPPLPPPAGVGVPSPPPLPAVSKVEAGRKPRRGAADRARRPGRLTLSHGIQRLSRGRNHPVLTPLERHYSDRPEDLQRQLEADRALIEQATAILSQLRASGAGKLVGRDKVGEFAGQAEFLDGHVHVLPPSHPRGYELTVLGDLHGCYSCLKGALMQSDFLGKVERFRKDPAAHPEPKLVLLGDYIDRGRYSYNGVLRSILRIFVAAPRHVYVLRGNHEYYLEFDGQIYGGVKPAEAINTLKPHVKPDVFKAYLQLFEALPNMLLFDELMFVHGGIPRDALLRERYRDLASLNDADIRFQMMWSDPSSADVVPEALQAASSRFAFGRQQARAFLHRLGLSGIVRGHQVHESGLARIWDEPDLLLLSLFSAGGDANDDLPLFSNYRFVTPMALTIRRDPDGALDIDPWAIDYASYMDPDRNQFYRSPPSIAHVEG